MCFQRHECTRFGNFITFECVWFFWGQYPSLKRKARVYWRRTKSTLAVRAEKNAAVLQTKSTVSRTHTSNERSKTRSNHTPVQLAFGAAVCRALADTMILTPVQRLYITRHIHAHKRQPRHMHKISKCSSQTYTQRHKSSNAQSTQRRILQHVQFYIRLT